MDITFKEKKKKKLSGETLPWRYLGLIGEIGFAIVVPIAGGAIAGVFVDKVLSSAPKATLSLLFLGVIVSFINLFKTVKTITKET